MRRPFLGAIFVTAMMLPACSSVTFRDKGTSQMSTEPTYEDRKNFFFWGLAGESHVDLKEVCGGGNASQWQAQDTFVDGLLGAITLGIYMPRSAKVWCEAKGGRK